MTIDLEEQLTAGMREEVAGIALTSDVLGEATRRHRRRTAMISLGYGLGVAGLAGVLAVGLTVGTGAPPRPDPGRPPAGQVQPPALRLANAVAASDDISYRLKVTTAGKASTDGKPSGPGASQTYQGAFDPKTATGYVRMPLEAGVLTELLIGGTRYIGTEPPPNGATPPGPHDPYSQYGQYPGKYDRLSYFLSGDPALSLLTPDPTALLKALKEANATTSENPDGTLHFQYTKQTAGGSTVTDGDVTLNADGRIAKVMLAGTWQSTLKGRLDAGEFTTTLELYDYGVAVKVDRPADVVPAN
jgi:hypothetical protein